jgi:anti-sigma factor RsiW
VICLIARHRLGAYVDEALEGAALRAVALHVEGCPSCRRDIDGLRRTKALLRTALPAVSEPDWSGFWPGIVRGVQDGRARPAVRPRARWSRRWVLSGVGAAALAVVAVVIALEVRGPVAPAEEPVVVTAANTQYSGGTMVYHTPEKMAVVWVFDDGGDGRRD